MHQRAVARLDQLQQELDDLRAKLRLRERQLFERKSEQSGALPQTPPAAAAAPTPKRPRGQQPGRPSPPRRRYDHLPAVEEVVDIPADQQQCPDCGQPWQPFPGTEDAELLEIEVRAYRRV